MVLLFPVEKNWYVIIAENSSVEKKLKEEMKSTHIQGYCTVFLPRALLTL